LRATKIDNFEERAEGNCCGFPYNTELASINGCWFHVWLGDADEAIVPQLLRAARNQRDVVRFTYSNGAPTGYWAHEDFGKSLGSGEI
jgi:hypothetical protein